MSTTKIRKRDTGEAGNKGEFGTIARTDAVVDIAQPGPSIGDIDDALARDRAAEDLRRRTVSMDSRFAERAEAIIEKANRRLEREGIDHRFTFERTDTVKRRSPTASETREGEMPGTMIEERTTTFVLNRPEISHEGWTFGAVLDREPGTDTFMLRSAGRDFGGWRPEPGRCDHCGQFRERNQTFLVSNPETGEMLQVGSTCVQAFLGVKPKGLWALGVDLTDEIDDDMRSEPAPVRVMDNRELIARSMVASDNGKRFVGRGTAVEWGTVSTVDSLDGMFEYRRGDSPESRLEKDELRAQAQSLMADGTVDDVIAAAREVGADTDYGRNLTTLLDNGFVSEKGMGTVASAVAVYGRKQREAAREQAQEDRVQSAAAGFIGEEKDRLRDIPVTITNIYEGTQQQYAWPHGDEPFQLITMRTEDGHEVVWRTTNLVDLEIGTSTVLTGTVKSHEQYRGVDQTKVIRAKLEVPVERDADGIPVADSPFDPSALGRVGKRLKNQVVRVEEAREDGGVWRLVGRTPDNHRIRWDSDDPEESGQVVTVDGTVDWIDDVGVKTAVIARP
ncbi:hypothetical protein [Brachybacterium kimchii]|uniref:Uncharacterized protein n=1 Tax=Brachybacterium kimchii TaxID=2942909 RepID=A0ABY4N7I6_9MICO|nr:hypothetical protein [Brachybacterium kimchii]UQN30525.1 hypothetical protein M4486_04230 [Brachybacterium kimchii]